MLAGSVKTILDTFIRLFIFNLTGTGSNVNLRIGFFPCMTRNAFSLNLEGIATANKLKLIKKAVCTAAGVLINLCKQNINKKQRRYKKCTLSKT